MAKKVRVNWTPELDRLLLDFYKKATTKAEACRKAASVIDNATETACFNRLRRLLGDEDWLQPRIDKKVITAEEIAGYIKKNPGITVHALREKFDVGDWKLAEGAKLAGTTLKKLSLNQETPL